MYFDFGNDPSSISRFIKGGVYRSRQLHLFDCGGDIKMFAENVPILDLHSFTSTGCFGSVNNMADIPVYYPTIKRLFLCYSYNSSATLLKFVECCRYIEVLSFCSQSGRMWMSESDIESIASIESIVMKMRLMLYLYAED
jgi:hypothetical protein